MGRVRPRWAPRWPHEPCYKGHPSSSYLSSPHRLWNNWECKCLQLPQQILLYKVPSVASDMKQHTTMLICSHNISFLLMSQSKLFLWLNFCARWENSAVDISQQTGASMCSGNLHDVLIWNLFEFIMCLIMMYKLKINTHKPNTYICDLKWCTDKAQTHMENTPCTQHQHKN